jgi:hypothetical protein
MIRKLKGGRVAVEGFMQFRIRGGYGWRDRAQLVARCDKR